MESSDGTTFVKASTNADCCTSYSISRTEDGTNWRWPLLSGDEGSFECHGGIKKTFDEWLDFMVQYKHMSAFQNICVEGWRYTMSGWCRIVKL